MITTIAVIIITTIIIHCYNSQKAKKSSEQKEMNVLLNADELIRKTGAEIKEVKENGEYVILYQGGCFEIHTSKKNYIDVYYNQFIEFDENEAMKALYSINLINLKYLVWNCNLNINDEEDENVGRYHASLTGRMELTGCMEKKVEQLKEMMIFAFEVSRDLSEEFNKEIKEKETVDEHFLELTLHNRLEDILKKSEILHSSKLNTDTLDTNDRITLSIILDKLGLPHQDQTVKIKIIDKDNIIIPESPEKIMRYDICEYIRKKSHTTELQEPTFLLDFSNRKVIMCFELRDETANRMYYNINILGYSNIGDTNDNFSIQTMLEINLSDGKDEYWEVKYMIDDAMDKHINGKRMELSDEQRLLLKDVVPGLNSDLYWGKKYHNKNCYHQALVHYSRAFKYLQKEWLNLNDHAKDVYVKVALYIGIIYMELGIMDKAHYYLDIAANYKASIGGITEYTNCLCNMGDPNTLSYIENSIKRISEIISNAEEPNEPLEEFLDFLYRRMVYSLITHKAYDTAENMLKDMIKNDKNVDFANNELAYLQKIRQEENTTNK